jgi:hypothetical protein
MGEVLCGGKSRFFVDGLVFWRSIDLESNGSVCLFSVWFMREAFHHFKHKPEMLASIRRILAPNGRMLIKDQIKGCGEGYICPKANSREDVIATVTTNGFVLLEEIEFPTGCILFIFQKAGGE